MGRDYRDEAARAVSDSFIQGIAETEVMFADGDQAIRIRRCNIARPVDRTGIDNDGFKAAILLLGKTPEQLRQVSLFVIRADDDGRFRHSRAA